MARSRRIDSRFLPRGARLAAVATAALLALTGCDWDPTAADGSRNIDLHPDDPDREDGGLLLQGPNGSLELTSLWLTLEEIELDGEGDTDDFEAGPVLVELPLEGEPTIPLSAPLPEGSYEEIEIEFEPVDDDEFLAGVRERFPDWPEDASLRATGTFTPEGDPEPVAFETYVEAEIEIELEPSPPLVVDDSGSEVELLTVDLSLWFRRGDGSVVDLSRWDYEGEDTEIPELEVEIEDGSVEVEWD